MINIPASRPRGVFSATNRACASPPTSTHRLETGWKSIPARRGWAPRSEYDGKRCVQSRWQRRRQIRRPKSTVGEYSDPLKGRCVHVSVVTASEATIQDSFDRRPAAPGRDIPLFAGVANQVVQGAAELHSSVEIWLP